MNGRNRTDEQSAAGGVVEMITENPGGDDHHLEVTMTMMMMIMICPQGDAGPLLPTMMIMMTMISTIGVFRKSIARKYHFFKVLAICFEASDVAGI